MSVGKMKEEKYLKETAQVWHSWFEDKPVPVGSDLIVHANTAARWIRDGYAVPVDQANYEARNKAVCEKVKEIAVSMADGQDLADVYDKISWIAGKAKDALGYVKLTVAGKAVVDAYPWEDRR